MINKQAVIDIAIAEIGYHEKASNFDLDDPVANSGSGNYTKYARDLDAIDGFYNGKKNGYPFCDVFTDWCFVRAYGVVLALQLLCQPWGSAGAGCEYSAQYYEKQGRFFADYPEPGDQIFFDYGGGISHTGIVIDVNDFAVTTVEGNSNDQVQKCSYPLDANYIAGYGRPNWAIDGVPDPAVPDTQPVTPVPDVVEVTAIVPTIKYGDVSPWVKVMQTILIGKGFTCGWYGADGEFGTQTKIALFEFRKANGLPTDNNSILCDASCWGLLLHV